MNVLILGFYVTEDNDGYVETIYKIKNSDIGVLKFGLWEIQPHHLAFF